MPLNDPIRNAVLRLHKADGLLAKAESAIATSDAARQQMRRWLAIAIGLAVAMGCLAAWGWLRCS